MKRFLIACGGLSPTDEKSLHSYFTKSGSWWHWVPNVWLFACDKEDTTAAALRDHILKYNHENLIVMEIERSGEIAWRGARSPEGATMGDWLKSTWAVNGANLDDDIPF